MGGTLSVESVPGNGSTFSLWAPFLVTQAKSETYETEVSLQGLSILVVDDNATNRGILQDTLAGWEARATTAANAEEAFGILNKAALAGSPFDLAVLDGRMPNRDGFSLTREIRGDLRLKALPIIILTSASQAGDVAKARELGIAAYLLKPVRRDELRGAIRTAARRGSGQIKIMESHGTAARTATEKILVVEDSEDNRLIVEAYLRRSRFVPDFANDGREGVEKFIADRYSMVLMDIQMPVMDGYEATRRIREWEREQHRPPIPIVALTANAFRDDEERCRDAGCSAFLSKPIKKATLLEVLDEHLGAVDVAK